jgi:predicted ATPase/transcriptional regulator with XRE-family HTH domain
MDPASHAGEPSGSPVRRPHWSDVLRALREARGATQEGWAARLGVGRVTVQRWERGERVPDPGAEAAILAYCRDAGLFRTYDRAPLAGFPLSAELLQDLFAEARFTARRAEPGMRSEETGALSGPHPLLPTPRSDNLPRQLTSFVGREQEIAAVRRVQAGTRLLTLTGAGGCGKTRLALEVAGELLWAYPHGVCFVDLAPLPPAGLIGSPQTGPSPARRDRLAGIQRAQQTDPSVRTEGAPQTFNDPVLVLQAVATALQIQTTGQQPLFETLTNALTSRHLLLVLDNCEHLLPDCAELVETLLRACPHLAVMATSRQALAIRGETVWRVPTLALPDQAAGAASADASRLFIERARLQWPEWAPAPGEAEAVVAICRRLDGMPLAIELAAARVAALSVEQIAERLRDRFRLLTSGNRATLPRHQTLRAAMDWSHDLLTAEERALLRRLAVFAGGFTLEAAEAVCGDEQRAMSNEQREDSGSFSLLVARCSLLDVLAQLVDKSLVITERQDGAARYRMLETVRQYAQEKLDHAAEGAAVRERHHGWCLALAETAEQEAYGPRESEWFARLEREHDNLRSALAWSLAPGRRVGEQSLRLAGLLPRFWGVRGHLSEGRQWLSRLLAAAGDTATADRATALRGAGFLAFNQGDFTAAHALAQACLPLCRELEDGAGEAYAEALLGKIAYRRSEYDLARAHFEASLARNGGEGRGSEQLIAMAHANLGAIARRQGDYERAHTLIETSLAIHRALENKQGIASTLDDVATLAAEMGDDERAEAALAESLALFRELGSKSGIAMALGDYGIRAWQRGDHDRASGLLDESLALYREQGEHTSIARVLGYQSVIALFERDYTRAEALSRECLTMYQAVGEIWAIGRYLPVLAGALFGLGQAERAARLLAAAAALRERLGAPLPLAFRTAHDRTIAAVRRALGEAAFAAAWNPGAAMPVEDALAEALAGGLPT